MRLDGNAVALSGAQKLHTLRDFAYMNTSKRYKHT